jgi:hypothetical protein
MMAQALMFGLDVGIYGRLATRDHILELAALAEVSGSDAAEQRQQLRMFIEDIIPQV